MLHPAQIERDAGLDGENGALQGAARPKGRHRHVVLSRDLQGVQDVLFVVCVDHAVGCVLTLVAFVPGVVLEIPGLPGDRVAQAFP